MLRNWFVLLVNGLFFGITLSQEWSLWIVFSVFFVEYAVVQCRIVLEQLGATGTDGFVLRNPQLGVPFSSSVGKRGSVRPFECLPPIHPNQLPYAVYWLTGPVFWWPLLFVFSFLFVPVLTEQGLIDSVAPVVDGGSTTVSFGVVVCFTVTRHAVSLVHWTNAGEYIGVTPTELRHPLELFVLCGVMLSPLVALTVGSVLPIGMTAGSLLVSVFVVKTVYDLRFEGFNPIGSAIGRPGPLEVVSEGRDYEYVTLGEAESLSDLNYEAPPKRSVVNPFPDRRPDVRSTVAPIGSVRTRPILVAVSGLPVTLMFGGGIAFMPSGFLFLLALGGVVDFLWPAGVLVFSVCLFHVVYRIGRFMTQGSMEYRVYEEELVAYDTLLDESQWSIPRDRIGTIEHGGLWRRYTDGPGAATIEVFGDDDVTLRYLDDPETLAELLDRSSA